MSAMPPPAGPGAIDSPGDGHGDSPAAQALAALRARGAGQRDPVRFHFIEALARRTAATRGTARALLEGRLARAIDDYAARCEGVPGTASAPAVQSHEPGEPPALSPLAELLAHIAGQNRSVFAAPEPDATHPAAPAELKALSCFRDTWSKLRVDQQFHQALADEPENAGPLNSHFLVLRALRLMRDISPAYLKHFMDYADALLWLEQADGGAKPPPKNIVLGERDKKRKPARGKAGG